MAVLYKSFQSVLEDKNHKKMFHPRVIYTANISTSQIAKEIAAYSSLSPGDVKNTLDNLVTVMGQHLQASESVSLDGFGTSEEVSAAQASLTVRFLPNFTKNPDRTTATRSLVTGAKCVRFDRTDTPASGSGNTNKPGGGDGGEGDGEEAPDPTV